MNTQKYNLGSEVAVVLGGGIALDGTPSRETVMRAKAGVQLAKARPNLTVVLSGYAPAGTPVTEAAAMKSIFVRHRIARKRLLIEDQSRCTMGNAILVASRFLRGAKPGKLYVVTSPFHAKRALQYFSGVFGPAWDIEIVLAEALENDAERATKEVGGMEWGTKFFSGIEPGDVDALIDRLREQRPVYNSISFAA